MNGNRLPRRAAPTTAGFSLIEMLVSMAMTLVVMAGVATLFLASKRHIRNQALELETTQAARASANLIVRELRLSGACLPVTGEFIALEGVDSGAADELITRTGLTGADLSCVRSATTDPTPAAGTSVPVVDARDFTPGMRAYVRHPNGTGEYFTITSVDTANNILGRDTAFSADYPATSGVYGIDERRFYTDHWDFGRGLLPQLVLQVNGGATHPFAVGIEELDIAYELNRACPPCDVVDLPADAEEWSLIERVLVTVTARSERPRPDGEYYRRTVRVGVKPRNLAAG